MNIRGLAVMLSLSLGLIVVPSFSMQQASAADIVASFTQSGVAKVEGKNYRVSLSISGLILVNDGFSSSKASGSVNVFDVKSGKQVGSYSLKEIIVKPFESKVNITAKVSGKSGDLSSSMSFSSSVINPKFDEIKKGQQALSISSQSFKSSLKFKVIEKGKTISYDTVKTSSGKISYSTYITPKVVKLISKISRFGVDAIDETTYEAWFGVIDQENKLTSMNGKVSLSILDARSKVLYTETRALKESDFGTYTEGTDPTPKVLYVWDFPISKVAKGTGQGLAKLTLVLEDGKELYFTNNNISIPTLSPTELQQAYEDEYLSSSKQLDLTVIQGDFQITLIRAGKFTHLKYGTWGDEVNHFRADFAVTNLAQKPEYIPYSSVVLDEANNQYDEEYGGSLGSKELYPNVTVRGYKIYDSLPDSAQLARVIIKEYNYPQDILWVFDVPLK